jgi:pyruvate dehydrogenase E2 component (dihydrolipoamide acetyltransferase)
MEEGTILKWLVEPGAIVTRGQEIVEIETDKATMTYEADSDGPLSIVAAEGDTLAVGAIIATIGEGSGGPAAPADGSPEQASGPAPERSVEPPASPAGAVAAEPAGAVAVAEPAAPPASEPRPTNGHRPKASPLARRLARERGVDLAALTGTGPGGRIVRADVDAAATAPATATAATPAPAAAPSEGESGKGAVTVESLTRLQQVIARRMAESRATVPEFTLTTEVDMEAAVALRAQIKDAGLEGATVPSYNDFVVKACALALREHPRANGAYKDGAFELYSRVNVGIAVAAQDALVVPTVFDADKRTVGDIAAQTRLLAERVRSGEVTPPELSGGTFTVSNLGMFGVTEFTAVINVPQAAILAVGAMTPRPVVRDGEVVVRNVMAITLSCDHRILYGADAAQFLARIRALLESPLALLV